MKNDVLRWANERLISRYLGAVGLSAAGACALVHGCGRGARDPSAGSSTTITMAPNGTGTGSSTAVVAATRPLPTAEPCAMCGLRCVQPSSPPPAPLYPAPYEHCAPDDGAGGLFGVRTTDAHRATQPGVCCYLNPSQVPPLGRPLPARTRRDVRRAIVAAAQSRPDWAAA